MRASFMRVGYTNLALIYAKKDITSSSSHHRSPVGRVTTIIDQFPSPLGAGSSCTSHSSVVVPYVISSTAAIDHFHHHAIDSWLAIISCSI
ncbi:Thioredoxin reductase aclD [Fusarium oxysporum f. sp. albedinis]|nr:Thioredoxin reductase aclD [Fusarium oxysporum f. sp. albedinis]